MKNFLKKFLTLSMVVATAVTCTVGLTACNNKNNGDQSTAKVNPVDGSSFVNVDINPNIDLVVDKNGAVLSVVANNEDAEDLLFHASVTSNKTVAEDVKGQTVSIAIDSIVKASVQMEYVNDTNKDVKVLAVKADGSVNEELLNKAKTAANSAVEQLKASGKYLKDVTVEVVENVSNSLQVRLANAKEQIKKVDAAAAEALTTGKLLLMESIDRLSAGAVEMVELAKLSVAELNQYIYDLGQEVKVVTQGFVEKVQAKAITEVTLAEAKLKEYYDSVKPSIDAAKFIAARELKDGFVWFQNKYVEFINKANAATLDAMDAMKVAPNSIKGQNALEKDVNEIANDLFTDDAKKDAFKAAAKDSKENRYTYKSVAKATENELDNLEFDGSTDKAIVAKAHYNEINNKINGFVKDNQDDISKARTATSRAIKALENGLKKGATTGLGLYVKAVEKFNEYVGQPAPEPAPEEYTTYAALLGYVSDLLTSQNAVIENAFVAWSEDYVTPEVHTELVKIQAEMANAKENAIKFYENEIKDRFVA